MLGSLPLSLTLPDHREGGRDRQRRWGNSLKSPAISHLSSPGRHHGPTLHSQAPQAVFGTARRSISSACRSGRVLEEWENDGDRWSGVCESRLSSLPIALPVGNFSRLSFCRCPRRCRRASRAGVRYRGVGSACRLGGNRPPSWPGGVVACSATAAQETHPPSKLRAVLFGAAEVDEVPLKSQARDSILSVQFFVLRIENKSAQRGHPGSSVIWAASGRPISRRVSICPPTDLPRSRAFDRPLCSSDCHSSSPLFHNRWTEDGYVPVSSFQFGSVCSCGRHGEFHTPQRPPNAGPFITSFAGERGSL